MTEDTLGYVHSIETFGSVDGPGIRFVVFMQGCRLRCAFCHNPDTWNIGGGTPYTAQELIDQAVDYQAYWGDEGGITISGGEPLLQIDFILELFKLAKEKGVHTAIDSCGGPFTREEPFYSVYDELMQYTDLVLMDIKHINNEFHKKYTMAENTNILEMARDLADRNIPMWIRHVLVPEHSDFDEDLKSLSSFIQSLGSAVKNVEVLPYHKLGVYKYKELGIPYRLEGIEPPTKDRVENANRILMTNQYQNK
ncbi:pyruvate formate lyase activating enzyme [Atopostipes suicloacalis DSM 15692]|uniref:Pyruvate formate-lyase-activating enzyme n=1 Tax=Atopostipes suicloacalis DSM 15692 TaxID=1121025 RepID=A0A1M4WEP5_9LACT|nr:pyruvate formate-lyase-activating protein [Atopostipes suicloacalis]SHE79718.1 pyruvate formate lyase activating enzyme [Atopostipes suicloacalis DSM 15692]